jgi:hypothetical protein
LLRIARDTKRLTLLSRTTLPEAGILERRDLQEFIWNDAQAFFGEIGQEIFLIGKEVEPSTTVPDRIDLLGIDRDGQTVIIELKRGGHKLHMLQAMSYAGMIARWTSEDILRVAGSRAGQLREFLDVDDDQINREQKLLLVAEEYDYALLTAAEWLSERYGVGVTCAKVGLAKDQATGAEYLACSTVYPPPELAEVALVRPGAARRLTEPGDWESILAGVDSGLANLVRALLDGGATSNLARPALYVPRFGIGVRKSKGQLSVTQRSRFAGDLGYWQQRLSSPTAVTVSSDGRKLRLALRTQTDFDAFRRFIATESSTTAWGRESTADDELELALAD